MLDLYAWGTPNGKKIPIMLEELGLAYTLHKVDISKGQQQEAAFLALNPNGKIPALVDSDGPVTVFESGAILIHLAEKTGRFLPKEPQARAEVIEWLMFQMSAVGPMSGQLGFFKRANSAEGIARFEPEVKRIYGVLNGQLGKHEYLAGDYSIADMATFPWILAHTFLGLELTELPHLKAWLVRVAARPAVKKALAVFE